MFLKHSLVLFDVKMISFNFKQSSLSVFNFLSLQVLKTKFLKKVNKNLFFAIHFLIILYV